MKNILISLFLLINIYAQDEVKNDDNIVKTSELELFLFKIGFQSLLNDVDITKDKVSLNEDELKKLNSKVKIIMDEVYKNKRVLKTESAPIVISNNNNNDIEIKKLKEEMLLLKDEIEKLKSKKEVIVQVDEKPTIIPKEILKEEEVELDYIPATVRVEELYVRSSASANASILEILKQNDEVQIEKCSKHGWCKFKGEKKYVAKFLLNF
ncbi:SH3 domain-containing protein [Poseidonibacter lekithochrous]|uniref:SH3 domain-containing protein n=1 Tax=Poseidonibacter lekithochrous TaxID=1904463 RepID=UPI000D3AFA63|nr:SH3 domain-containing protein [Poseidonibacter lekithochrous]